MSEGVRGTGSGLCESDCNHSFLSRGRLPAALPLPHPTNRRKYYRCLELWTRCLRTFRPVWGSTKNPYVQTAGWSSVWDLFTTTNAFQVNDESILCSKSWKATFHNSCIGFEAGIINEIFFTVSPRPHYPLCGPAWPQTWDPPASISPVRAPPRPVLNTIIKSNTKQSELLKCTCLHTCVCTNSPV